MFERIDAIIDERIKKHKENKANGTSPLVSIIRRHSYFWFFGRVIRDTKIPKETGKGKRVGENAKKIQT